jgi:hypothetical protein
MIAIHTRFIHATDHRGSRIKAFANGYPSVTIPYPYALSGVLCHFEAVTAFIKETGLDVSAEDMRYGDSADGRGFCFCFSHSVVGH